MPLLNNIFNNTAWSVSKLLVMDVWGVVVCSCYGLGGLGVGAGSWSSSIGNGIGERE